MGQLDAQDGEQTVGDLEKAQPYSKEAVCARKSRQADEETPSPLAENDTSGLEKAQPYGKEAVAERKSRRASQVTFKEAEGQPEAATKVQPYSKEAVVSRRSRVESQEIGQAQDEDGSDASEVWEDEAANNSP